MSVRVLRHDNAESFLDCAESWLLEFEAENNLIFGIARSIQADAVPAASNLLLPIREGEPVVGCAIRIPPRSLLITRMERPAIEALIHSLSAELSSIPAVMGPEPSSGDFAVRWSAVQQQPCRVRNRGRFYVLRRMRADLPEAPGHLRPATSSDVELVTPWVAEFAQDDSQNSREVAMQRITAGQLYLWQASAPVSMAALTGATPNGRRVGMVFTPPAERRHGYASACVAALSSAVLSMGNSYCCLYADLANLTANGIYARIGYEPLYDATEYALAG
jgi:predicted GNAT family acetyltransferase